MWLKNRLQLRGYSIVQILSIHKLWSMLTIGQHVVLWCYLHETKLSPVLLWIPVKFASADKIQKNLTVADMNFTHLIQQYIQEGSDCHQTCWGGTRNLRGWIKALQNTKPVNSSDNTWKVRTKPQQTWCMSQIHVWRAMQNGMTTIFP